MSLFGNGNVSVVTNIKPINQLEQCHIQSVLGSGMHSMLQKATVKCYYDSEVLCITSTDLQQTMSQQWNQVAEAK
jgi:hypothetical protein